MPIPTPSRSPLLPAALLAGLLAVPLAPAAQAQDTLDLVGPISEYKLYVLEQTDILLQDTTAFVAAVKAGELEQAKALFAPTRISYERIEPIAELFQDLDVAIDSRADDYEGAEADPDFPGFHRIEYGLWSEGSTEGLGPVADRLLADVTELHGRIDALPFPPEVVVGGAAALMEEVAATKISGEEDRYSHTDLWDFRGNFDGAKVIVDLLRPLIDDAAFLAEVDANFATIDTTLETYRDGEGYQTYDKLTETDRVRLAAAVNVLAESLSTLRGRLGLD